MLPDSAIPTGAYHSVKIRLHFSSDVTLTKTLKPPVVAGVPLVFQRIQHIGMVQRLAYPIEGHDVG